MALRIIAAAGVLVFIAAAATLWWFTATMLEASGVLLELTVRSLEESS